MSSRRSASLARFSSNCCSTVMQSCKTNMCDWKQQRTACMRRLALVDPCIAGALERFTEYVNAQCAIVARD